MWNNSIMKGSSKHMIARKKINYIKKPLYVLCLLLGGVLSAYSSLRAAWLLEVILMIVGIFFCFDWKIRYRKVILVGLALFMVLLTLVYNVKYLYPYLQVANSTLNMENTQISIPQSPYHKDMWIYPIVNHKTVNLYYADKWCWNYFEVFSENTQTLAVDNIDSEVELTDSIKNKYFVQVGYTLFGGVSSLFSEEVIEEISKREVAPYLYLAIDGLADSNEVVILTDKEYGIYIMPIETIKNIVGDVAK